MSSIPRGFRRLQGSERRPSPSAKALGIANPNESFAITIVLRRRLDGAPLPDHDFFLNTPPSQRQRMSSSEFAVLYGASNEDIDKVTKFVTAHHLTIIDTHAARRTVIVSGTVQQMESFFATRLERFEHQIVHGVTGQPTIETYRGLDGFIHIPEDLEGIIVGVFGLDNRTVTKRNRSDHDEDDPPDTTPLTVPQVTSLYDFPDLSASGQTIAIFSRGGYKMDDIKMYFKRLGLDVPIVQDVNIDGATNTPNTHRETTMDICVSASAAPGASVAVYFTPGGEKGWVDLIGRVVHPNFDDPVCSVLSSSYYRYNGDDGDNANADFMSVVSGAFHDAAMQGVTVCVASGDKGSYSKIDDDNAHVQYPASDPWVLTVGGTTIGNVDGSSYDEYVWNHRKGATGGGVSAFFPVPFYQRSATVPVSVNDNKSKGRGVPDAAANSSPKSGYAIPLDGVYEVGAGTSAAAPLWAGLIARINVAMGENVGYVNPALYALGSSVFNDIDGSKGPTSNKLKDYDAPGYPAKSGWDACTGWGSPKGSALLDGLNQLYAI